MKVKKPGKKEVYNATRPQSSELTIPAAEGIDINLILNELKREVRNAMPNLTTLVKAHSGERKAENKDLKEALNITRVQLMDLKKQVEEMKVNFTLNERKPGQNTAITNLTKLVKAHSGEMKAKNKDLKEALNMTRVQLKELKERVEEMDVNVILKELKQQKNAIANLTTLVGVIDNLINNTKIDLVNSLKANSLGR